VIGKTFPEWRKRYVKPVWPDQVPRFETDLLWPARSFGTFAEPAFLGGPKD